MIYNVIIEQMDWHFKRNIIEFLFFHFLHEIDNIVKNTEIFNFY